MAVDDILAAIRAETDAEIERVRARAAGEVETILARGRDEAAAAEERTAAARDAAATRDAERIVNRARLTADRRLWAAAEEIYQDLVGEVRVRLAALWGTLRYRDLFGRLLDECLAVLPDASPVLVDPQDEALVRGLPVVAGSGGTTVEASLRTMGGLEVATDDGRFVRNTFESRLERADIHLRLLAAVTMPALRGGT